MTEEAASSENEGLLFGLGLGEPWKLTIVNSQSESIELTVDELYEIALWLKLHLGAVDLDR